MASDTTSVRVLLPTELKDRVKEFVKGDPTYVYNEEPSVSAFARDAFEFFLAHKSVNMNHQDEQPQTAA